VVGGGDPNISGRLHDGDPLAVFRPWAAELRRLGVRRVEGDVYLVHGLFEPPRVHPDWPRDQLTRWYEAPVEALSFNDNAVLVRVSPGPVAGRPARVETVPDLSLFSFDNRAATTGSRRRHRVAIDRVDGSNRLRVAGAVLRRAAPVESWVAVADPLAYFGAALREALAEEGVAVSGEMRPSAELPPGPWRRVAEHRSDLLTTVEVILKRSQNFYAESLLKLLGAELCGEGSWEAGLEVVAEYLDGVGIARGHYRLADGSGMSRGNRMSPRQLTWLLGYMRDRPLAREFMRALPHSGEPELRWERRLAEPPYRGNVFAKTGFLNGVSTLSGYAKGNSGRLYAFSILMNGTGELRRAQRAQDRIVRALIEEG
jgi:D-alanyl-D-alanine carboxypeptidase/D-alanyl-D-alanine-endopeptidase (penicillin-binding protein 4)